MLIINKIFSKTNYKIAMVVCMVAIFITLITVNLINNKFFGFIRLDLTSNKMFTLSKGSKEILSKIDEPITLKLFFSKQLAKDNPFFLSFASRVEEFLKLYQRYSKNKINLQIIDPAPFTEDEDQAVFYGLQGIPVNANEADLYFGLVGLDSTTGKEIIPFLQPSREGYLEYDITQLIYKLSSKINNKIAVISSLPIQGNAGVEFLPNKNRPWLIWEQIKQQFDAKILSEEQIEEIPRDIKVLLLIHSSQELPLKVATYVDQFVMRGGRVLLLVDPLSEINPADNDTKAEKPQAKNNTTIPIAKLLAAWGIEYDPNKIVASRSLAKHVRYNSEGRDIIGLYPLWLDINASSFAKDDVITANLTKLTFATAGSIAYDNSKAANIKFVPLVTISDAMLINKEDLVKYKSNPTNLFKEYQPQEKPTVLAARITGKIKSAFSNKSADSNIVVVANADFLYDNFWATAQNFLGNPIIIPNAGNAAFILNSLDNLIGSDALISIRNKDAYAKGFDKIKKIELSSQNKFQQAEEALLQRISETKRKLSSMDQNTVTAEHKLEEEMFRKDLINTRKQLREVRRSLREDIQSLENRIKMCSMLLVPSLILIFFVMHSFAGTNFLNVFSRHKRYDQKFK